MASSTSFKAGAQSERNVAKGIFRLARLHTLESFVCWYPAVWGICLSSGQGTNTMALSSSLRIIIGNIVSITLSHCTWCTFNDICDRNFDSKVDRTKERPLPSGMISVSEACLAFAIELVCTVLATQQMLGWDGVVACGPLWLCSAIYPFMKRLVPWPQLWLGPNLAGTVFLGWVSAAGGFNTVEKALPLFAATSVWVVYFDTFYASQDARDDKKIGVKSLAVWLGDRLSVFLGCLGALQVALLSVSAKLGNASPVFWGLGVCVWGLNVPYHVLSLDKNDRKSGGKIFKMNILLGLYLTMVSVLEFVFTSVSRTRL